jgi:hypothetical protein
MGFTELELFISGGGGNVGGLKIGVDMAGETVKLCVLTSCCSCSNVSELSKEEGAPVVSGGRFAKGSNGKAGGSSDSGL